MFAPTIAPMATVYLRGKNWIAQWMRPGGERVKRNTGETKRREAELIAAGFELSDRKATPNHGRKFDEILSRAGNDAKGKRLTPTRAAEYLIELRQVADPAYHVLSLADHLTAWTADKALRVKPSTAAGYGDMRKRFSKHLPKAVLHGSVTDLTDAHIEAAMRKMKKAGLRGSTINLALRALRQSLKRLVRKGIIPSNPTEDISPMPEGDSTERAPFTAQEVRAMIDHPKTSAEWKGMILFGAHTGLRMGDCARLGSDHMQGTDLHIRPEKTSRTRKTVRIPLTPPLLAWTAGKSGRFFPLAANRSSPVLSMQFKAIMKRAGVPPTVKLPGGIDASRSFHSLRHSFTSWLAEADIHADVRQKLTGHSTAASHALYTHHDAALKRAIDTLPDLGFNSAI